MTTALLESPLSLFGEARRSPAPAGGRGVTLEERLETAWRAVQADGLAECPVCRAAMRREGAAGTCTGCGSTLA
jgi:hypothetical protein